MNQISAMARLPGMSLFRLVQLIRGETTRDPRPNKALRPTDYRWLLLGYKHYDFMVDSASYGLQPTWLREAPAQDQRPKNHKSATQYPSSVARCIRSGQDGGQYLVVADDLLQLWPEVQISPLGAVEKSGIRPEDEVRLIHDLKRPIGSSTNEATDRSSLPALDYRPVADLAARVEALHARGGSFPIRMMKGDVKGAFRHLMVHASSVGWMGARLPEHGALVVDLSAPFGWTSSPTYYGAYGGAITWLVQRESPASLDLASSDSECFYAYEWVDDHVLIEFDAGNRLELAATALRSAMMAIFGPRALNEKKFSAWESRLEVLGLEFDVTNRTISMPVRKIEKACSRIDAMRNQPRATRSDLMKLLGSLRHVCTCTRAAKPFFQRVQALCTSAPPFGTIALTAAVLQDLEWCKALLASGQFRDLPMSMFAAWPAPDIHLYMDASNLGLAVLDPAANRFLQLRFDDDERALIEGVGAKSHFTINVREQLSIALASTVWGPLWRRRFQGPIGHVWCWVDNVTAVAAANKLASNNPMAQELNRHIGYAEAVHGFRIRCIHLPGRLNTMADAASRAWAPPFTNVWLRLKQGWTQDEIAPTHRKLYEPSSVTSNFTAWREAPARSTQVPGSSGAPCDQHAYPRWLHRDQTRHSEQLALFATHCWSQPPLGRGNAPDTVLSKISALSWHHRLHRGYPVGLHAGHLLAVRGMRRLSAPPVSRVHATVPLLRALRSTCDLSSPHDRVLWGAAVVGFFYLLRSSEYLSVNGSIASTALTQGDVTFCDARGCVCDLRDPSRVARVDLALRGSKTDQEGRGYVLSMERSGSGWLCPVLAVIDLLTHAKTLNLPTSAHLSAWGPGRTVTAAKMNNHIQRAAAACGVEPSRFGTHSLRAGGATGLTSAGVGEPALRLVGRWKSDSVYRYTRLTAATTRTLAARMLDREVPARRAESHQVGSALHAHH